ncbi:MAG TPA: uracil-DNA glycosylase family protein [Chloroflexia bacterium]|nr:uracil-DNA glycosylase family protein [Chloroflexia bacterium]
MAPPPILLVGQAPGLRATRERIPFAGQSGARLRGWFALAGFSEDDYWRHIYFSAVTKCYPGRLPGAKGDRVPTPAEQALCRPWLDAQLAVLQPPIVVLVGQLAIGAFLGKGSLSALVGEGFERAGRRLLPLPHPSGVSTWLNDRDNQARVARAMAVLAGWVQELGLPLSGAPAPEAARPAR